MRKLELPLDARPTTAPRTPPATPPITAPLTERLVIAPTAAPAAAPIAASRAVWSAPRRATGSLAGAAGSGVTVAGTSDSTTSPEETVETLALSLVPPVVSPDSMGAEDAAGAVATA